MMPIFLPPLFHFSLFLLSLLLPFRAVHNFWHCCCLFLSSSAAEAGMPINKTKWNEMKWNEMKWILEVENAGKCYSATVLQWCMLHGRLINFGPSVMKWEANKQYEIICQSLQFNLYFAKNGSQKTNYQLFFAQPGDRRGGDWLAIKADSFSLRQVGRETERAWERETVGDTKPLETWSWQDTWNKLQFVPCQHAVRKCIVGRGVGGRGT